HPERGRTTKQQHNDQNKHLNRSRRKTSAAPCHQRRRKRPHVRSIPGGLRYARLPGVPVKGETTMRAGTRFPAPGSERGVMLIEALAAILIFSIGILAVVGMQAVAIKDVASAKYRSEAAFLAQ